MPRMIGHGFQGFDAREIGRAFEYKNKMVALPPLQGCHAIVPLAFSEEVATLAAQFDLIAEACDVTFVLADPNRTFAISPENTQIKESL